MLTRVSSKGQLVIPAAIREMARIRTGDELEVGYANGLVVMRKRRPLDSEQVRDLLQGRDRLPDLTDEDEREVADAVSRVRGHRRR